jgi:hypothetical protein
MKTTIRLLILMITISLITSCSPNKKLADSGNTIGKLSESFRITEGSLVYGLPRTVFTVFVEMERTIEIPGPYARFAGDMLGLDNVIKNESEYWSIRRISVRSDEELDPSEYYIIKSNNIFLSNVLALKKEGLILDLNPEIFYHDGSQTGTGKTDMQQFSSFDLGSDEYFQLQRDTAYRRVNVDSTFIRIPYIVEKKRKLTADQLAERAALKLMELREGKHLILTGEANVFPQSDAAIVEIRRIEKEYTELFAGKIWKETKMFTYQIIPQKDMVGKPFTLFRFSDLTGPLDGSSLGGIPVTVELIPEQKTKGLSVIISQQGKASAPTYDKLYYRVPDVVNLKISTGKEILFNSRRLIYQLGEVIQLPSNYIIGK